MATSPTCPVLEILPGLHRNPGMEAVGYWAFATGRPEVMVVRGTLILPLGPGPHHRMQFYAMPRATLPSSFILVSW